MDRPSGAGHGVKVLIVSRYQPASRMSNVAVGLVVRRAVYLEPADSAAVAQLVERVLGKDEVVGSSPTSSLVFRVGQ